MRFSRTIPTDRANSTAHRKVLSSSFLRSRPKAMAWVSGSVWMGDGSGRQARNSHSV